MIVLADDLWLCPDCTVYVCNGDLSGCDDDRAEEIERCAGALALAYQTKAMREVDIVPSLVSNSGDEDGHEEFSWRGCDCCDENAKKGGELHRFAVLGPSKRDVRRARSALWWGRSPGQRATSRVLAASRHELSVLRLYPSAQSAPVCTVEWWTDRNGRDAPMLTDACALGPQRMFNYVDGSRQSWRLCREAWWRLYVGTCFGKLGPIFGTTCREVCAM